MMELEGWTRHGGGWVRPGFVMTQEGPMVFVLWFETGSIYGFYCLESAVAWVADREAGLPDQTRWATSDLPALTPTDYELN